jgi:ribosomal protein L37AE/L43A
MVGKTYRSHSVEIGYRRRDKAGRLWFLVLCSSCNRNGIVARDGHRIWDSRLCRSRRSGCMLCLVLYIVELT